MPILAHIGFHKTATTWLQFCVFEPEIGFSRVPLPQVRSHIISPHALDFDPRRAAEWLRPLLRDAEERALVPVLSHERLSGHPHSGGFDAKDMALRLAELIPEARVLIVIREQRAMILSCYSQYVRMGGVAPLSEYVHPPERGRHHLPLFDLAYLRYDRLIRLYQELFGTENVLVLAYEEFRSRPMTFLGRIMELAEVSPDRPLLEELPYDHRFNRSLEPSEITLRRMANRLVTGDRLNPAPLTRMRVVESGARRLTRKVSDLVPAFWEARITDRRRERVRALVGNAYRDSNRRTSELTGLDLEGLGYDVG